MEHKQMISTEFVKEVKDLINKSGMSTRALSKKVGKSSSYISQIITRKIRSIDYPTAYNILVELMPQRKEQVEYLLEHEYNIKPDYYFEWMDEQYEKHLNNEKANINRVKNVVKELEQKLMAEVNGELLRADLVREAIDEHSPNEEEILTFLTDVLKLYKMDKGKFYLLKPLVKSLDNFPNGTFDNLGVWDSDFKVFNDEKVIGVSKKFQELLKNVYPSKLNR
ncbi:hypothetical protein JCM14036_12630 [Desulfotomaculum defluvii]